MGADRCGGTLSVEKGAVSVKLGAVLKPFCFFLTPETASCLARLGVGDVLGGLVWDIVRTDGETRVCNARSRERERE